MYKGGAPSENGAPPLLMGLDPLLFFPPEEKIFSSRSSDIFLETKPIFPRDVCLVIIALVTEII